MRKFTEEIDKSRVIRAGVLAKAETKGPGDAVPESATVRDLARMLVRDTREVIPVERDGVVIGGLNRQDGLTVLREAT